MVSCGIAWRAALALSEAACPARDCSSASAIRGTRGETCPSIRQTCLYGPECYKAIGCPSHRGLIDGEGTGALSGDIEPRVFSFDTENRIFRLTHLEYTEFKSLKWIIIKHLQNKSRLESIHGKT